MKCKLFIADATKLNADPPGATDVRWFVEFLGRAFDQHRLDARGRGHHDRDVPVVVVIEGTHCEDLLADEEGRFPVREFLGRIGQGVANAPDSLNMFLAHGISFVSLIIGNTREGITARGSKGMRRSIRACRDRESFRQRALDLKPPAFSFWDPLQELSLREFAPPEVGGLPFLQRPLHQQ